VQLVPDKYNDGVILGSQVTQLVAEPVHVMQGVLHAVQTEFTAVLPIGQVDKQLELTD
jgi:hypothetical protein